MIKFKMKPGDILLLPTEYTEVYTLIAGVIGDKVAHFLPKLLNEPYLHAEIYIGNGYTMAAWQSGVHIHRYPLSTQMKFDVYRHKDNSVSDAIKRNILEDFVAYLAKEPTRYLNKPYDFKGLFNNTIAELASVLGLENKVETSAPQVDTPDSFICSELVARIYNDAGYPLTLEATTLEWVSPSDLANAPELYRLV